MVAMVAPSIYGAAGSEPSPAIRAAGSLAARFPINLLYESISQLRFSIWAGNLFDCARQHVVLSGRGRKGSLR
jgi:hypothetical protein